MCTLIFFALGAMGQETTVSRAPGSWQHYMVKDEEFSVAMPLLPAMSTSTVFVDRHKKERRERRLGAYADGVAYTVACFENHSRESLEAFIKNDVMSGRRSGGVSEQDLIRDGFKGKQFSSEHSLGWTIQVFATGKSFYEFKALGVKGDDARVKHYFSSVKLGKGIDGIEVSDGIGVQFEPDPQSDLTSVDTGKAYTGKEVDRKVVLAMKPEPTYTKSARREQIMGTVVFKVIFSATGSVVNIVTVSGLPYGLTERAMEAARKIKFIPAQKNGKFVSMWIQLEYNFNLY